MLGVHTGVHAPPSHGGAPPPKRCCQHSCHLPPQQHLQVVPDGRWPLPAACGWSLTHGRRSPPSPPPAVDSVCGSSLLTAAGLPPLPMQPCLPLPSCWGHAPFMAEGVQNDHVSHLFPYHQDWACGHMMAQICSDSSWRRPQCRTS